MDIKLFILFVCRVGLHNCTFVESIKFASVTSTWMLTLSSLLTSFLKVIIWNLHTCTNIVRSVQNSAQMTEFQHLHEEDFLEETLCPSFSVTVDKLWHGDESSSESGTVSISAVNSSKAASKLTRDFALTSKNSMLFALANSRPFSFKTCLWFGTRSALFPKSILTQSWSVLLISKSLSQELTASNEEISVMS